MFKLKSTANCPCGNTNGTPLHYATESILTASFHMSKPAQQHELIWFLNVASNKGSRLKIQRLLHRLNDFPRPVSNNSMIISYFQPLPLPAGRHGEFFAPSSPK
ncbi:hypothetical protein AVEN_157838-1 [Araneus ventricosus]|uniref:Uncharacterized protein n=1 Tax=Araneus ventricosus TaxID=182803 RepID=A0A4Y2E9X8_ARAVE|nr:hypothetical protein AVEN_157838-1 [Araneus ventricosus]